MLVLWDWVTGFWCTGLVGVMDNGLCVHQLCICTWISALGLDPRSPGSISLLINSWRPRGGFTHLWLCDSYTVGAQHIVNELVSKWLDQAIDTEIIRSPASNIGCPLSLSLPPVTSTCTAASPSALRGTYPSLSFVFYYWEHKREPISEGGIYFGPKQKTVGDFVGRDGNSWTRWGDSCPEVLRISSVLWASEADSATALSVKLSQMQGKHPRLLC